MYRYVLILLLICGAAAPVSAQDLSNIQIHGFVTQGFLYSTNNNYLSMNSTSGSLQWTDGAVSISGSLTDKLRASWVGIYVAATPGTVGYVGKDHGDAVEKLAVK